MVSIKPVFLWRRMYLVVAKAEHTSLKLTICLSIYGIALPQDIKELKNIKRTKAIKKLLNFCCNGCRNFWRKFEIVASLINHMFLRGDVGINFQVNFWNLWNYPCEMIMDLDLKIPDITEGKQIPKTFKIKLNYNEQPL